MSRHVDVIVVGQGIAGTSLAFSLMQSGLHLMVLDREEENTASRVSAGLVTPVTGQRFAVAWQWVEFLNVADQFYSAAERATGESFWSSKSMVRLFQSSAERDTFLRKFGAEEDWLTTFDPHVPFPLLNRFGGFEMTGRELETMRYLKCMRQYFWERQSLQSCSLNWPGDVEHDLSGVRIPRLELTAEFLILCQGFQSQPPREFAAVRFNPSKGEILTVQVPELHETRVVHSHNWLKPRGNDLYDLGATYDWADLSTNTTPMARRQLVESLRSNLDPGTRIDVVDQKAAVRPTMHDFRPVIGRHPEIATVGILNGLGSKGGLMAPRLAQRLTEHILTKATIPPDIDVQRWFH